MNDSDILQCLAGSFIFIINVNELCVKTEINMFYNSDRNTYKKDEQ
jgi:hypothetical protein